MSIVSLKVKIKSLAAESRIIRHEERKRKQFCRFSAKDQTLKEQVHSEMMSLQDHRRFPVRSEARHAQLAYGFLRGVPYRRIEAKCYLSPDWESVKSMIKRFGVAGRNDLDFEKWRDEQPPAAQAA